MQTSRDTQLYAISTCGHCKHMREYLEKHKIPFSYTYIDKLEGEERKSTLEIVRKFNPRLSFPTVVVDSGKVVIVGFEEEKLKQCYSIAG